MDPITISSLAVLYPFLIEMAKKGAEKIVETSSESLTNGSISWLKSLFFKYGEPKNALKNLVDKPESVDHQNAVKTIVENSIEDNPENEKFLKDILQNLPKISNVIANSKNVVTGNVNTGGGNFITGDNNQIS
ncbi:hypothetical protein [Kaistella palustris]|uniref:hypothetical protein n=1 Tax=Kaistella palustris TaxID=493376 RepID=UPI0004259EEB|nr:hypothetical protein [Kaistella palustris]